MKFPVFFSEGPFTDQTLLNEETSRHVAGALRMTAGDTIGITDGKGNLYTATITEVHKKRTAIRIISKDVYDQKQPLHTIAISLLKNTGRFEWFLEKATELGIGRIVPLICERTKKQGFRFDRMQQICISAMLQSQQVFLPLLSEPVAYKNYFQQDYGSSRYIAHCLDDANKIKLSKLEKTEEVNILIGPEGDFTPSEIELAKTKNFIPVSLGSTRLRTETAALVATLWLTME